ncbi:hypothetical protein PG993_003602 [Apiospora rasikravindrae]|uniref:Uncharacterized protein n=1 Tax=Apiospora rasikravindrae TaxID=990691 RepID=A0ABR1U020_9PEZI
MGTKGLDLNNDTQAPEKSQAQEGERPTTADSAKSEVNGEMRLAWMFVQGWRQRLQRGEQLVEEHRSEAASDDGRSVRNRGRRRSSASINSRLSYVTGSIESAELRVKPQQEDGRGSGSSRVRKDSVYSGSDL